MIKAHRSDSGARPPESALPSPGAVPRFAPGPLYVSRRLRARGSVIQPDHTNTSSRIHSSSDVATRRLDAKAFQRPHVTACANISLWSRRIAGQYARKGLCPSMFKRRKVAAATSKWTKTCAAVHDSVFKSIVFLRVDLFDRRTQKGAIYYLFFSLQYQSRWDNIALDSGDCVISSIFADGTGMNTCSIMTMREIRFRAGDARRLPCAKK
ncbi:MAG: hypothetical protein FD149_2683 [Rhodospirillaceae bacterium]|nr:MAG: hypothetical protein FD149_2683 [Rhodospirillaceae bacterium]